MHTHPEFHRAFARIHRQEAASAAIAHRPSPTAGSRWAWTRRTRVSATPPAVTSAAPRRAEGCSPC